MTTPAFPERTAMTTTTTGTGALTLIATIAGHQALPAGLNTRLFDCVIEASNGDWEIFRNGSYTHSTLNLTRGTFVTSNTGAVLTLVAGTHTVRIGGTGDRANLWETEKLKRVVQVISAPATAGAVLGTDYVFLVSGTTTLTLPTAVGNTNQYTVKNTGGGVVSVASTSAQTFDTTASPITIPVAHTSLDFISDGSNWRII